MSHPMPLNHFLIEANKSIIFLLKYCPIENSSISRGNPNINNAIKYGMKKSPVNLYEKYE